MQTVPSGNTILWDCMNYDDQEVAPGIYYYTINEGAPRAFTIQPRNLAIRPVINNLSYSLDTLRWEIANSFCYLSLDIRAYHKIHHDTFLVSREQWNQFHLSSADKPNKKQPLPEIYCSPCFAKFTTWRPDGANGSPVTYQFSTYACGDWTDNGVTDLADLSTLVDYLT